MLLVNTCERVTEKDTDMYKSSCTKFEDSLKEVTIILDNFQDDGIYVSVVFALCPLRKQINPCCFLS